MAKSGTFDNDVQTIYRSISWFQGFLDEPETYELKADESELPFEHFEEVAREHGLRGNVRIVLRHSPHFWPVEQITKKPFIAWPWLWKRVTFGFYNHDYRLIVIYLHTNDTKKLAGVLAHEFDHAFYYQDWSRLKWECAHWLASLNGIVALVVASFFLLSLLGGQFWFLIPVAWKLQRFFSYYFRPAEIRARRYAKENWRQYRQALEKALHSPG